MNCEDARLHIGAEPNALPRELAEHLEGCPACAQFHREMVALDANIRRALEQPPMTSRTQPSGTRASDTHAPGSQTSAAQPEASDHAQASGARVLDIRASGASRRRRAVAWSGWALAASVLLTAFATVLVWLIRPSESLAHEVVMHVQKEPQSWGKTAPVPPNKLNEILRNAGVELDANSRDVVYAQSCEFRGRHVPHLVVRTARGPVTVLILRHEMVKAREHFQESGMTGVIAPAPHGSIAVLAHGNGDIDDVAEQLRHSVRWLPKST